MERRLHKYQVEARNWIVDHPFCGVFMEMGLGKTITTLSSIYHIKKDNPGMKTLIIGPKRVAENVWDKEIENWKAPLTVSVIKGNKIKRNKAEEKKADVYVVSVHNITKDMAGKYDMVVIDELSLFKNSNTTRFKTAKKITSRAERVVGLTGTPTPNGYMDLWSQMYLVDGGDSLGCFKMEYQNEYFRPAKFMGHVVIEYKLRKGADIHIKQRLKKNCISFMGKDWLKNMPTKTEVVVPVTMEDKTLKQYKDFMKAKVAQIDGNIFAPSNAGSLLFKAMQFANGFLYTEDKTVVYVHDEKIKALKEIQQSATSNILVAYNFKEDLDRLKKEFPEAVVINSSVDINEWNEGNIKMGLLHPKSGGHGLNLQEGGSVVVWYSPTFSLEERLQFNARLHRQGQKSGVIIHTLVTKGTIEEKIVSVLDKKDISLQDLMIYLKKYLQ